jgi:hypothetical protein
MEFMVSLLLLTIAAMEGSPAVRGETSFYVILTNKLEHHNRGEKCIINSILHHRSSNHLFLKEYIKMVHPILCSSTNLWQNGNYSCC